MTQEERGNEYRMNLSGPLLHARSEMETIDLDRTTCYTPSETLLFRAIGERSDLAE